MKLSDALGYVEGLGGFRAGDRMAWIYFRNGVLDWLQPLPNDLHPEIRAAVDALDMPEKLAHEAERWEELFHQVERHQAG